MHCHVCNVAVGEGQQFCHECGESLDGVTDPTEPMEAIGRTGIVDDDAVVALAPTQPIEVLDAPIVPDPTGEIAITPITADPWNVETLEPPSALDIPAAFDPTTTMPVAATGDMAAADQFEAGGIFDGAADVAAYSDEEPHGFKLRAAFVLSVLALVATLMANVAEFVEIRTSRPVDGIKVGFTMLDDVGTNLGIAGLIGVGLMVIGGLASCFGLRWGAGLAGGSGLALIGWAAISLGLMENRISDAQLVTRATGADVNGFTLFITRDLGWFLMVAVAAIGLIVFLVSLRMAGTGARRGLNPWIAAVGALAMVIVAAGPLIPLGGAPFDVNFGTGTTPREFFAARLIQLGLIMVTGVVGFLSVRTYGLGFAAGGLGVSMWLWITALVEGGVVTGDVQVPVSIAVGNVGTFSTVPHAVTTVGMTASLALLVAAATMAALAHHRR